jgi:hypothetical protein
MKLDVERVDEAGEATMNGDEDEDGEDEDENEDFGGDGDRRGDFFRLGDDPGPGMGTCRS